MERKLNEDFKVNKYDLVGEAEINCARLQYYAEQFALAEDLANRAKVRMKLKEAEAFIFVQENPPDGKKAPTVDMAKALVLCNPEVQQATEDWLNAEKDASIWKASLEGIRDMSGQIKNLKELMLAGIYNLKD